jgi:anaerobic glycerol-3-phosphate dehydrogenase C subunit
MTIASDTFSQHSAHHAYPAWLTALDSALRGKVRWDAVTLQLYSTAACFYEITPLAVVIPHDTNDVVTAIELCAKHRIPILPRGAGSSLSGNAVGEAVILDLSHHFKETTEIDSERVRSGVSVVLDTLQKRLKKSNRKFGPDPSSGNVCVIGGMLGNNSGGPHTVKHGNMVRHVDEISVVLANGKLFRAKNISLNEIADLPESERHYYEQIRTLIQKYREEIIASTPLSTKNASGYQVWNVLTDTHLNMASLFVGSEGTLGVFTDAVLRTIPTVKHRGIISFYFKDLAEMGVAVRHLRSMGASSIEFVDESFLKLALSFQPDLKEFLPERVKFLLYVEFDADDVADVERLLAQSKKIIAEQGGLAEVGSFSTNEREIERVVRVRKAATAILNKIQGKEKPVPFIEDAAIPPDAFTEFLTDLSTLLLQYPFRYAVYGHAGDGNLHLRPILNFKDPQSYRYALEVMEKFVDLVLKHKGTLSGEHGDGRLRTPFVDRAFPKLVPLFKEIKDLFDPAGIMNPGIKVPKGRPKWNEHLRYTPDNTYEPTLSRLDSDEWKLEIEKCHGCGTCREYCPVFIATGAEEATARAKANILRGIISGSLPTATFDTEHFYRIMDYCVNCGQCLTDCPTGVNIPGMAVLAKEKLHEKRPFKINEFILQHGKTVSTMASVAPAISNWTLSLPLARKLMQTTTGIDSRRTLPPFAVHRTKKSPGQKHQQKVVLWSGCAAQYNDPNGELENSIQLLRKMGYDVVLPEWKCCNIAKLSYGNLKAVREDIEFNLRILLPYVKEKIPILFSSASCGYAFRHEYVTFFGDNHDIRKVAEASSDIHDFLGRAFEAGDITGSFKPLDRKVAYHAPCHLKTQKNKYGPLELLRKIPDLVLLNIADSCCGIAGTFGMKEENFDLSMAMGVSLFSELERVRPDVVLSGCGTCQIQINQGTGMTVLHPITLLNESFRPSDKDLPA